MNIPDMTIDTKQNLRSESVATAKAVDKPPIQDGNELARPDVVSKQHNNNTEDGQKGKHTREELEKLVAEATKHLEANNVKLKFNLVEEGEEIQVEVLDSDGKTIRKIPDDDLLKLAKSLKNLGKGFLDTMS